MELNSPQPPLPPPAGTSDSQADLPTPQRQACARVLRWGTSLALAGLFITFTLYAARIVPPAVPFAELSTHWGKPLEQFHKDTGLHERFGTDHSFNWITHLNLGDFLVYLPIAMLAAMTIVCYATLLPYYVRQRAWLLLTVAVAQLLVLVLAATGVAGRH